MAWKALHAYFSASALRTPTTLISRSRNENISVSRSVTRSSEVPRTTKGGWKKSATPEPSRRNSGHIAVPTPSRPVAAVPAKVSWTRSSPVPGGTVLRTTTAWNPDAGGLAAASPARMSSRARRRYVRSVPPCGDEGVPTQTKDTSARSRATTGSVVARSLPLSTAVAIRLVDARLDNRTPTRSDVIDLYRVDVDPAHVVPLRGQTCSGNRADIAQTKNSDPHSPLADRLTPPRRGA